MPARLIWVEKDGHLQRYPCIVEDDFLGQRGGSIFIRNKISGKVEEIRDFPTWEEIEKKAPPREW